MIYSQPSRSDLNIPHVDATEYVQNNLSSESFSTFNILFEMSWKKKKILTKRAEKILKTEIWTQLKLR